MAECNMCKKEVEEVYECKECGRFFGKDCGDPKVSVCKECQGFSVDSRKDLESDITDDLQDMDVKE